MGPPQNAADGSGLPNVPGGFGVALADPGHLWRPWSAKGAGRSAQRHYRCEAVERIAALPVAAIMAPDSVLFLWCTWPLIFTAKEIIEAWGFTYSGLAWEWLKYNPATGKYAFGLGFGTRKNLEPCLLARRGNPKRLSASVRDFIIAPRREHSRKPDEQYERIEALFPGPFLELFARRTIRPGWAAWGDELLALESTPG
jgi:N6-adenosine-specific RNA methylase IME4